jgi:hypothetical protein
VATALERARAAAVSNSILFPSSGGRATSVRRSVRAARGTDYRAYLDSRYNAAEAATRGNLVSAQGRRLGISGNQFFTGQPRSMRYASPELKDWFRANGSNLTASRYRSQATSQAPRASSAKAARSSGS